MEEIAEETEEGETLPEKCADDDAVVEEGGAEEGTDDTKTEGEDPLDKVMKEVYEEIESIVGDIGGNATEVLAIECCVSLYVSTY